MKNTVVILLFIVISLTSVSQSKVINLFPQFSQGYLSLDRSGYPSVAFWTVEISQRFYSEEGNYVDKIVDQIKLTKKDFIKISSRYFNPEDKYIFTIKGMNLDGQTVIEDGPWGFGEDIIMSCPECGDYSKICEKKCNGTTYGWQINHYKNVNNSSSYFNLNSTFATFDQGTQTGVPYYQYMSYAEFNQLQSWSYKYEYYGISNWQPGQSVNIITIPNTYPLAIYYNSMGMAITSGMIIGVKKYLGNWAGEFVQSPILQTGNVCSNSKQYFIDLMNDYADVSNHEKFDGTAMPDLICEEAKLPTTHPPILPSIPIIIKCAQQFITGGSISGNLFQIDSCINGLTSSAGRVFPDYIIGLSIGRVDKKMDPITLQESDFINETGEFVNPSLSFEPGLYSFGLILADGSYLPVYKEFNEITSFYEEQANFLDVIISPVPIQNNEFNLHLEPYATLNFDYILYDFSGNELYRNHFDLRKDNIEDFKVCPKYFIPSGMLLNKFIFEDGSQLNIQTIKE